MGKILEAFRKFQQDVHEMDNADQLNAVSPQTTIYDMYHYFMGSQKGTHKDSTWMSAFDKTLNKQPHVYHAALNNAAYSKENPQNKVLLHGILFKALFNIYMKHVKKGFDNVLLSEIQLNLNEEDRQIIDFVEYNNLPKRFRGIFVKYDADHYVLNAPHSKIIITYKKQNRNKLEALLLRAKMLIPVIYKEKLMESHGSELLAKRIQQANITTPAFVLDSPSAKCVSDEQLKTVHELRDIFIEIAKISLPKIITQKENVAAKEIYAEYTQEIHQQDIFVRTQNEAKELKINQDNIIKNAYKAFKRKKKQLKANYREYHSELMNMLANETGVRIK